MTFEQLLYVEVLSHYSSLQEAADLLHITKPGLSLAISELEKELGVKLFERTTRGSKITQAGIQLLSSISGILQAKSEIERLVSASKGENKKEVIRIRYINTMFKSFITQFISHYQDKYSNALYDICRDDTHSIIDSVRKGDIDAGFIAISDIESEWVKDLIFKPVCSGKVVLGVSKKSDLLNEEITLEKLKKQKFCIYDDVYHEVLFDRLQYLCGPLNLILKTDDHWAIMEVVTKLDAVCIGRSSQALFSREEPRDDLVSLPIGNLLNDNTTLGWLINPSRKLSSAAADIINSITKEMAE